MPGERSKDFYENKCTNNGEQRTPTREASASSGPSTQNGQMSHDSPKLEQEPLEQQQVQVSIVERQNVGVFEQPDESDTDEQLEIHASPTNSLFQDHQQNGENNDDVNLEYEPHTPTATPPPTPPSLPPTPTDTEDDFEEQDQEVKQERRSPSPPTSPVDNDRFLYSGTNSTAGSSTSRPRVERDSLLFPGEAAIRNIIDRLLNGNLTPEATRRFDTMAGAPPEHPPHIPYFSFFPGPGMYPVPTQLYCSYSFLLKCLSVSMSYISFRDEYEGSSSSNRQNGFSGTTGTSRPRGSASTSSSPPGFGMVSTPSAPIGPSTSSKSSTPSAASTVTSQTSNTSSACGRRMFAPPPPLLSPIRDGPSAGYFVPCTFNGSHSKTSLTSPTSSSAWRFTVPVLHLQPPSRQQQQQQQSQSQPVNVENGDARNHSSLSAAASSSQMSPSVGGTRGRRRERRSRRNGTRSRSRSRSQNRFSNEQRDRTDRRADVINHHHHYHRLSPLTYPYLFNNNCRHNQGQRRCDFCRDSFGSLLDFDCQASTSSSLRRHHDHDDDNEGRRGRRRGSRDGRNDWKSKSDYSHRDRR